MELGSTNRVLSTSTESRLLGHTDEQYQELLQFVSKMKGTSDKLSGMCLINGTNWILDTGASWHMTGKCGLLEKRRCLTNPFSITLLDGKVVWTNS